MTSVTFAFVTAKNCRTTTSIAIGTSATAPFGIAGTLFDLLYPETFTAAAHDKQRDKHKEIKGKTKKNKGKYKDEK